MVYIKSDFELNGTNFKQAVLKLKPDFTFELTKILSHYQAGKFRTFINAWYSKYVKDYLKF